MTIEVADAADIEVPLDTPALDTKANPTRAAAPEPEIEVKVEPPKVEKPKKIVTTDEGLETLRKQLADEQKEREREQAARRAAEARAASAEQSAASAQGRAQDSELTTVTTGLAHVKQLREGLRRSFADASAADDHVKMAAIQDEMAEAAADQKMLERAEQELKTRPKPQPQVSDPVEQFIATLNPNTSARSAAWIRANPEVITNPRMKAKLGAAHQLALADGCVGDSPDYLEHVAKTLGIGQGTPGSVEVSTHVDTTPQRASGGRSTAPAAAPVSRSGTGSGSRPKSYTLTPDQQQAAKISGLTNREYAEQQMEIDELRRRGELN